MTRQTNKDHSEGVRAVGRALDIVELLARSEADLRIADIVQQLGLKRTTVYRLLKTLLARGYVQRNEAGATYRLGPRTFEIGSRFAARLDLRAAAIPALQLLAETTGDSAYLIINSGGEALCLDRVDGKNHIKSLFLQVGGRMPLSVGAAPRVLMAFMPDEEREAVIRTKGLPQLTPRSITDPFVLRQDLANVRDRGYAISDGDATLSVSAIGAPVYNHQGHVSAALSVGGPSSRFTEAELPSLIALLLEAAQGVSKSLGYNAELEKEYSLPS